ncbi:hypothetical protein HDU67_001007, partial [Dinochytrium kinnereticum]
MSAFNETDPWSWAWSAQLGGNPNITTVPNQLAPNATSNITSYTGLGVKHSKLQIDANMMFLVDATAKTIDVLSYWYLNPRRTPAKEFAPRSIPFPENVTTIDRITSLDSNFGVYASTNNTLYYIPVTDFYTASLASVRPSIRLGVFEGTIGPMWLVQDFSTLYLVEHIPGNRTTLWRWTVSGPTSQIGLTNPQNTTSPLHATGTPLLTLNQTTWPPLPYNPDAEQYARGPISSIAADSTSGDVYVGLDMNNTVLVYKGAGRFSKEPFELKAKVEVPFQFVRALEMDNDGRWLFVAGGDGRVGRVASVEVRKVARSRGVRLRG